MISENVARYIREKGVKQTVIADAIGISAPSLNNKLQGKTKLYAEEYFALCEFLNVPTDYFRDKDHA